MAQARRRFTDDFKREAVALLVSSGRPLTQIAGELGIAPSMLRNWRRGGRNSGPALPHPSGKLRWRATHPERDWGPPASLVRKECRLPAE
jgi:transposase